MVGEVVEAAEVTTTFEHVPLLRLGVGSVPRIVHVLEIRPGTEVADIPRSRDVVVGRWHSCNRARGGCTAVGKTRPVGLTVTCRPSRRGRTRHWWWVFALWWRRHRGLKLHAQVGPAG
jgi:hypothetical protein